MKIAIRLLTDKERYKTMQLKNIYKPSKLFDIVFNEREEIRKELETLKKL